VHSGQLCAFTWIQYQALITCWDNTLTHTDRLSYTCRLGQWGGSQDRRRKRQAAAKEAKSPAHVRTKSDESLTQPLDIAVVDTARTVFLSVFVSCPLTLYNKRTAATSKWPLFPTNKLISQQKIPAFPSMTQHNFKQETKLKESERLSFGIMFITDGQQTDGGTTDFMRCNPWYDQPPCMQLEHKLFAGLHLKCQPDEPFRPQSSLDILDQ
jgi:hypothetical protein